MHFIWLVIILCMFTHKVQSCTFDNQSNLAVLYIPYQEPSKRIHNQFFLTLLDAILKRTETEYGKCNVLEHNIPLTHKRIDVLLGKNEHINLTWTSTSKKREAQNQAVKEPLLKGLMGYRVMLVNKNNKHILQNINSIEQLRQFTFGLGRGWPDVEIMKYNKFEVIQTSTFEQLYKMLARGRFDLLSRGYAEALPDVNLHKEKGLELDPYLSLIYPMPVYFFVSKQNQKLANRLKSGIQSLRADGTFDSIFYNDPDIKNSLKQLNINSRKKLYLCNPTLQIDKAMQDEAFWHYPIDSNACAY